MSEPPTKSEPGTSPPGEEVDQGSDQAASVDPTAVDDTWGFGGASSESEPVSDFFTAAQDPAASFEELVDDLKTGAWHTAGSALDVDIVLSTTSGVSRAVRLRRVGEDVELKRLDPSCVVTVNGQVTDEAIVSLQKDVVEIDGQRLSDEMLPVDTLDLGDVPDYFAPILIGRSPDCDFVLTEDSVSARHAGLSRQDGYLLLEDLDSANGTYVADRRVKRVRVGWRTEFEIGGRMHTALDIVRTVRAGRLAESTSVLPVLGSGSSAMLGPLGGRGSGELPGGLSQAIDLDAGGILVVGRDPKADIVLDTPNVSRRHARIQKLKGAIFIEDLGSVNGTWINGERIQVRTQVAPGDDVRIGPQRLELTEDLAVQTQAALGGVTGVRLDAAKLIREVGSRSNPLRVIDQVSFSILPGEMVAIMRE